MSIDITLQILETLKLARPEDAFISSLHHQYCNRGGLSKKQLEGLQKKAAQFAEISDAHLATLQAIIKKKPTRYKSEKIEKAPEYNKNEAYVPLINKILEKYPQHKMLVFLQQKTQSDLPLSDFEINEINRLFKLLIKP
jgi:hypothetical protein